MFNLFKALSRLTAALARTAEIFENANDQLAQRLADDQADRPALEDQRTNGKPRGRQLVQS